MLIPFFIHIFVVNKIIMYYEKDNNRNIFTDVNGDKWLIDSEGELLRDENGNKIPAQKGECISKPGEFTHYDTSGGHCGLCGRLRCSGTCFK